MPIVTGSSLPYCVSMLLYISTCVMQVSAPVQNISEKHAVKLMLDYCSCQSKVLFKSYYTVVKNHRLYIPLGQYT